MQKYYCKNTNLNQYPTQQQSKKRKKIGQKMHNSTPLARRTTQLYLMQELYCKNESKAEKRENATKLVKMELTLSE